MTELVASNISISARGTPLVSDVSLTLAAGELVAILGPNGAGKTTLLRGLLGLTEPDTGSSSIDGEPVSGLTPVQRARRISYLPQRRPLAWPNKVKDVVALGRFAHGAALGRLSEQDAEAVQDALTRCDLDALADRNVDSLSGGELARVHFSRAIAARAPLLIADEPTAALDPKHQLGIATLIRNFVDTGGGALVVLHDVALAARFADRMIWMREGRIVVEGPPRDSLTADTMASVYGVTAHVHEDALGFDVRVEGAL